MTLFQNADHDPMPELVLFPTIPRDVRLAKRHYKLSRRWHVKGKRLLDRATAKMDDPRERIDQRDWLLWALSYSAQCWAQAEKHRRLAEALHQRYLREADPTSR